MLGPLLEVERSKKARRCSATHVSKSKCTKLYSFRALLEVQMSKKRAVVSQRTFRSQNVESRTRPDHFGRFRCCFVWHALVQAPCQERAKRQYFGVSSKRMASKGRLNTRDMFIRDVRRSGRLFLERGCILEHQLR